MDISLPALRAAFPEHEVSLSARADGSTLVQLEKDGLQAQRLVPSPQLSAPVSMQWLISALRRELAVALEASAVAASKGRGRTRLAS